jgi:hypothetical protein
MYQSRDFGKGHLYLLGVGAVGPALLYMILKVYKIKQEQVTVIDLKPLDEIKGILSYVVKAALDEDLKVNMISTRIEENNYKQIFTKDHKLTSNDIIIDCAIEICSIDIMKLCQDSGCGYVNSATELWDYRSIYDPIAYTLYPIIEEMRNFSDELKKDGINIDEFGQKGKEAIITAYRNLGSGFAKEAEKVTSAARVAESGNIPLTVGQATGDVRQIAKEEAMREGGRGGLAQKIMQRFEEGQKLAISKEATKLGEEIAPLSNVGTQAEAGGALFETLRAKQKDLKKAVSKAYSDTDLRTLAIPTETTSTLTSKISDVIKEGDFILNTELTPAAANAYSSLVNIIPKIDKANVTQINLKSLESTRRTLGQYYKAAANDADRNAVSMLTKQFDDWLDDTITKGLASGDLDQLSKLKEARTLSRDYFSKFKVDPRAPDVDAQKVIDKIVSKDLTPVETMNYLFGAAKLGDNQTAVRTASKFKEIFGENSPEVNEFRKAAYLRLVQDTQGNIKPASKIVNELDELIMGKGSALAKEVFTPEQTKSLRDFRSAISKTLTPAEATNPSKTGYEIARLGEDLFKGVGIYTMASGDIGVGGGMTALSSIVKPALSGAQAFKATKGISIPSLQNIYGAPVGIAGGNIAADLLREREDMQMQGLLGE